MKMMRRIILRMREMIKMMKITFIIRKTKKKRKRKEKEVKVLGRGLRRGKESKRQIGNKMIKKSRKIKKNKSKSIRNKRINLSYYNIFLTLSQLKEEEYVKPRCSLII